MRTAFFASVESMLIESLQVANLWDESLIDAYEHLKDEDAIKVMVNAKGRISDRDAWLCQQHKKRERAVPSEKEDAK